MRPFPLNHINMHQSKRKKRFIKIARAINKEELRLASILYHFGMRSQIKRMQPNSREEWFLMQQLLQLRRVNDRIECVLMVCQDPGRDPREFRD